MIENAVRHGIEPGDAVGLVRLTAHRENGELVLIIEDDGVGLSPNDVDAVGSAPAGRRPNTPPVAVGADSPVSRGSGGSGIGLKNLRARLQALYGVRQALELAPRPGGGVIVRPVIPWRPAAGCETPHDPGPS